MVPKLSDGNLCDSCCGSHYYETFKGIFEVVLKQFDYVALLEIKNSNFSNLIGNVVMIKVEAFSSNSINFKNCIFTRIGNSIPDLTSYPINFLQNVVSFYHRIV